MNIFRKPVILLVLVLLAFLLFGANKLLKMARNIGQSMRILKSEVKEMKSDSNGSEQTKATEESGNEKEESAVEGNVIPDSENAAKPGSEEQRSKYLVAESMTSTDHGSSSKSKGRSKGSRSA